MISMQNIGWHSKSVAASLQLTFPEGKVIFNAGENTSRNLIEHGLRIGNTKYVFMTTLGPETTGGLVGLLLSCQSGGSKYVCVCGPPPLRRFLDSVTRRFSNFHGIELDIREVTPEDAYRSEAKKESSSSSEYFLPSGISILPIAYNHSGGKKSRHSSPYSIDEKSMKKQEKKGSQTFMPECVHDEHIKNLSERLLKKLKVDNSLVSEESSKQTSSSSSTTSVCYLLKTSSIPGKFHTEKAANLKIPKGKLYGLLKGGSSVTLEDGSKILPEQVCDPPIPGFQMIVLKIAHSEEALDVAAALKPIVENLPLLKYVFHLTDSRLIRSNEYRQLLKIFPENSEHFFSNKSSEDLKITAFVHSISLNSVLSRFMPSLFPQFDFPTFKAQEEVPTTPEDIHVEGVCLKELRPLSKIIFTPLSQAGIDNTKMLTKFHHQFDQKFLNKLGFLSKLMKSPPSSDENPLSLLSSTDITQPTHTVSNDGKVQKNYEKREDLQAPSQNKCVSSLESVSIPTNANTRVSEEEEEEEVVLTHLNDDSNEKLDAIKLRDCSIDGILTSPSDIAGGVCSFPAAILPSSSGYSPALCTVASHKPPVDDSFASSSAASPVEKQTSLKPTLLDGGSNNTLPVGVFSLAMSRESSIFQDMTTKKTLFLDSSDFDEDGSDFTSSRGERGNLKEKHTQKDVFSSEFERACKDYCVTGGIEGNDDDTQNAFVRMNYLLKEKEEALNGVNDLSEEEEYPNLTFLGTGAAIPSQYRNVSGILLFFSKKQSVMLDCGEGSMSQLNLMSSSQENFLENLRSIKVFFISHRHADHHLGLPGLLSLRHSLCPNEPPPIVICPPQIKAWLSFYNQQVEQIPFVYFDSFSLEKSERAFSLSSDDGKDEIDVKFQTFMVMHVEASFGIRITSHMFGSIVYSGDTMPCENLVKSAMNCTILIHEATFDESLRSTAKEKLHSTVKDALVIGTRTRCQHLILTHFSQRYPQVPVTSLLGADADNPSHNQLKAPILSCDEVIPSKFSKGNERGDDSAGIELSKNRLFNNVEAENCNLSSSLHVDRSDFSKELGGTGDTQLHQGPVTKERKLSHAAEKLEGTLSAVEVELESSEGSNSLRSIHHAKSTVPSSLDMNLNRVIKRTIFAFDCMRLPLKILPELSERFSRILPVIKHLFSKDEKD